MAAAPTTLNLCFGEAHEDLLSHHQVFAEHRFAIAGGQATLYVIGASSIVLVETAGLRLAEMIACGAQRQGLDPLCEAGLSLRAGSRGQIAHTSPGFTYAGEVSAEPLSTPSSGRDDGAAQRVSHRFPSEGQPLTEIVAGESEPGRLVVRTIHEYPEFNVRVVSRSRWGLG